jgi:hypothetical protein
MIRFITVLSLITFFACSSSKTVEHIPRRVAIDFSSNKRNDKIDALNKGDTLILSFPIPHGGDLGITDPSGTFYFLVYAASDQQSPSLIDWNQFKQTKQLKIITDETKAKPWIDSIKTNQLIFTKSGVYEIQLSENLETDDGTAIEAKNVYYKDHY